MCRLAAYCGPEKSLEEFIISPPHSLYNQSWQPKEMDDATLNADGFGFAWYDEQGLPRHYRSTQPIWSDVNLTDLAKTLVQPLWLAYVRSATPGQGMGPENTQPFIHENLSFTHNGYIVEFQKIKDHLIEIIDTEFLSLIKGNTDSEYLFSLWLQSYSRSKSITDSFILFCDTIKKVCKHTSALLNIILTDGKKLFAIKYAIGAEPPSLYYYEKVNGSGKSIMIASEPFFNDNEWEKIPDNHLLIFDQASTCQAHKLS